MPNRGIKQSKPWFLEDNNVKTFTCIAKHEQWTNDYIRVPLPRVFWEDIIEVLNNILSIPLNFNVMEWNV